MCSWISWPQTREKYSSPPIRRNPKMKKLMTLMLGMSLMFGTVAAVFGQETPKKEDTKKSSSKKKSSKKKEEMPKKDGGSH
jgi:hypothetical protein